ncbi:MAG: copper-binding protein [Phycisphaeraceae bacterium]|nr:copper-binding protein [Phycisphaeraceae bacterium]
MLHRKGWATVAIALSMATGLPACDRSTESRTTTTRGEPDAVYVTRGRIEQLPPPERRDREILIHHEAVPEFTNSEGAVVGMGVMVMHFPLAKSVATDSLRVGDAVEFEWAVWWGRDVRGWEIRSIDRLPAGTELRLGKSTP